MKKFDVIVIGSGPGGYTSAIRNAQLGKKVALIEKYNTLGGTCLNVGCIPSKALLDSSEKYHELNNHFDKHGISTKGVALDFKKMIERKDTVVNQTCDGIKYLMGKNKIEVFNGIGSFVDDKKIQIKNGKTSETIEADNIIIATGSKPVELPFAKFDKKHIISSTEALSLDKQPKSIVIIGGGVIGLEMASFFARIGTQVKVVEFLNTILPEMDDLVSKEMLKVLKKLKIEFLLNTKVTDINVVKNKVDLKALDNQTQKEISLDADLCLVAVGRKAYTDNLDLEKAGLEVDERGRVAVNNNLQTAKSNIYAIGDIVQGAMLAHKAEEEGVFVAETIAGQKPHIDYNLIPGVVYTWPEAANVGKTEKKLKEEKADYKVGKYMIKALGRARASDDLDGFVKILADSKTDEILGVHMVAPRAADLIAEAVVAMEYKASAEDIARICHAHPTFSEALKEAALDATDKRSINS